MSQEKRIEKIISLMQQDNSVDAPEDVVKWAKNLYRTRERQPSLVQRIVAVLQADLLPNRAVVGERSASAAQARQMFFTAGDNGIDLRITGTIRKGFNIQGQILGAGFENASVKLVGEERSFEAITNETAVFELDNIPAGAYNLTVTGKRTEVTVEQVQL